MSWSKSNSETKEAFLLNFLGGYESTLILQAYIRVNELFAIKALEAVRKMRDGKNACSNNAPIIWVHDYQLMLAANTIR